MNNTTTKDNVMNLIKCSFWDTKCSEMDSDTYNEMRRQAIVALPAGRLKEVVSDPQLLQMWKTAVMQQIYSYAKYMYLQDNLPITVPYVILKGTAAAKYYPNPEYRVMGDIDIMTRREDFDVACKELMDHGYQIVKSLKREIGLVKNGIMIELHRYFASLNDPDQAAFLDNLIIDHINPTHLLPDDINGLTLLEHINQHLENGLGLRQIVDWMLFVDKCLPDEKWPAFKQISEQIGMTKLAIIVTRMCELYMGLPERKWCADADEDICHKLMEYIYSSGNFGNKQNDDTAGQSIQTMYKIHSLKAFFQLLQSSGMHNWKPAQKNAFLRKFAWLYQIGHYICKGFGRKDAITQLRSEHLAAQERKELFDALGVKQLAKGIAVYQDGKYRIKRKE